MGIKPKYYCIYCERAIDECFIRQFEDEIDSPMIPVGWIDDDLSCVCPRVHPGWHEPDRLRS
jgi:hypothetical protein